MTFKTYFKANNDEVSVTFEEAILLYQFCIFANVDLELQSAFTVNMVLGALTVSNIEEVAKTFATGVLTRD